MNSFLALQEQDITAFAGERERAVRRRVERDLRTARLVGNMIELFVPLMADTLNVMGGGEPIVDFDDPHPFESEPPGPDPDRDITR